MSDTYSYEGLSEKDKKVVMADLNEDPKTVNAHIESFRRWVKSMPHLKCPTDSKFLLMFLRVAKFDHSKAQKRLDNFCTIRSSARGLPEYFEFFKHDDPILETFFRMKQQIPLGRTESGEIVNFGMLSNWNPKEIPIKKLMSLMLMGIELQLQNEYSQIYGMKAFTDLHGCGKNMMEAMSDPKLFKSLTRIWQDCYPMRFKGQIIYREPGWYSVIYNIMEFFLNDKHRKRIFRIKDDIQKAFEKIPGLEPLLPAEYSGKGPKIDDCVEKWANEVREFYKKGSPWASISVDESKRPVETLKYMEQYADYPGENVGTKGTYTKFDAF